MFNILWLIIMETNMKKNIYIYICIYLYIYWVGQKVHWGFSVRCYNFLTNLIYVTYTCTWQLIGKESACDAGDSGLIPASGRAPKKEMATHASILAWRIPWTEKPDGLQFMGSQRVGHYWMTNTFTFTHTHTHIYILFHILFYIQPNIFIHTQRDNWITLLYTRN